MKAKSKRFSSMTAFNGREYVRYEWRDVPKGFEAEARRNPLLELTDDVIEPEPEAKPELEPLSLVEVEPVETPAEAEPVEEAPAKRHRRG